MSDRENLRPTGPKGKKDRKAAPKGKPNGTDGGHRETPNETEREKLLTELTALFGQPGYDAREREVSEILGIRGAELRNEVQRRLGAADVGQADNDFEEIRLDRRHKYQNVSGKGLYYQKLRERTVVPVKIANFEAWIEEEQILDDGMIEERRYAVAGRINGANLPTAIIPATELGSTAWVNQFWGVRAIVYPGMVQMLEPAIKEASARLGPTPSRRIYAHLGWRRLPDGRAVYLHAGGGLGADGSQDDISVPIVDGALSNFLLPSVCDLEAAVRASLGLLDLDVTTAAATWCAPLLEFCAFSSSLFVAGRTGSLKSALLGVAQSFWGSWWNGVRFPANWTGTQGSLEKLAFLAKDALFVIDDFTPTGSRRDVDMLNSKAEALFRGASNQGGRSRMRSDTTLRPTYFPRGLLAASGEDVPGGHSLRARLAIRQVEPGTIDPNRLSQLQDAGGRGVLAGALAGYLQWLAGKADTLAAELTERQSGWRAKVPASAHRRTPDMTAGLMLGVDMWLAFSVECGAIAIGAAEAKRKTAWGALIALAEEQAAEQREEDPVRIFTDAIPVLLASGKAHLKHKSGGPPPNMERFGWREGMSENSNYPQGDHLGWFDDVSGEVWLLLDPALSAINRMLRDQGAAIHLKRRTLGQRLREAGMLSCNRPDTFMKKVRLAFGVVDVLALLENRVWPPENAG